MSHIVKQKSKVAVVDLDLLEKAVQDLGGTLVRGKTQATFYRGKKARAEHVISFPGTNYEIALNQNKKTNLWEIGADLFCETLHGIVGTGCGKLFQGYRMQQLIRKAKATGWNIKKTQVDGKMKLSLTKM